MGNSPYTRELLEEAASSSRTLSEALAKLGVDPKSPTRRYLFDRMRKLGVDTRHFEAKACAGRRKCFRRRRVFDHHVRSAAAPRT